MHTNHLGSLFDLLKPTEWTGSGGLSICISNELPGEWLLLAHGPPFEQWDSTWVVVKAQSENYSIRSSYSRMFFMLHCQGKLCSLFKMQCKCKLCETVSGSHRVTVMWLLYDIPLIICVIITRDYLSPLFFIFLFFYLHSFYLCAALVHSRWVLTSSYGCVPAHKQIQSSFITPNSLMRPSYSLLPITPTLANPLRISVSTILPFSECYINRTIQRVAFWVSSILLWVFMDLDSV